MKKNEVKWLIACVLLLGTVWMCMVVYYNKGQMDALFGEQKYELYILYDRVLDSEPVLKTDTVDVSLFPGNKEHLITILRGGKQIKRSAIMINNNYWVYDWATGVCTVTRVIGTRGIERYRPADTLILNKKTGKKRTVDERL